MKNVISNDFLQLEQRSARAEPLGRYAIVLLMLASVLFLRPTFPGNDYSLYGIILLIGTTILYTALFQAPARTAENITAVLALGGLQLTFWGYCAISSILNGDSNIDQMFKGVALGLASAICYSQLFADERLRQMFFRFFAQTNSILGWSIAVSFLLLLVVPSTAITWAHVDIKGYTELTNPFGAGEESGGAGNGAVVLPFSVIYGQLTEYRITRFLGIYRESGIAQAFFGWSFFYLLLMGEYKNKWLWAAGAFLGSILCGSSTVVGTYGLAAMLYFPFRKNSTFRSNLLFIVLVFGLGIAAIYLPGLGLQDKLVTHGDSLEDRTLAVQYAFQDTDHLIFGNGLFYKFSPYAGLGVNGLSYVYYFGIVGFFLYGALFMVYPLVNGKLSRTYLALVSPFALSSFFFQPLIDAPLVYAMLYGFPLALGAVPASSAVKPSYV